MDKLLNFGSGYLTIVVGVAGIIWGIYTNDEKTVLIGLGLLGLRRAISNR